MSQARGNGQNGGHFYSNITTPVELDLNFVVDSTNGNGLGQRSLKSNGYVEQVYMNVANGLAGTPAMGSSRSYAVLGATAVSNTGSSVLTGNLGLTPGSSVTGFPPGTFSGVENIDNPAAVLAQSQALAAYNDLQARSSTVIASELGGQTLTPGVYSFASGAATLSGAAGALTLNGAGVYVIKTSTTLGTGASGTPVITLAGGATAANVYWAVGSSATLNISASGVFQGNIIANTSVTVDGGSVNGSIIALNGAVTFAAAVAAAAQPLSGGFVAAGNPNPLPGYCWVHFKNNFNKYVGGFSGWVSPLLPSNIAINSTALSLGQAYVIVSVGSSTLADWQAVGLPKGFVPTVGQSFIAIKSGNGAGSGLVRAPSVSGVNSVEVIGDANQMINNSDIAANSGAWVLLQFLENGALATPVDGSVAGMTFKFDRSSVTIDGL